MAGGVDAGTIGSTVSQEMGANFEIIFSLIGRLQAQGDYDRAMQLYQDAADSMSGNELHEFQKLAAPLVSNSQQMAVNSEGRQAQSRALSRLQQLGDEGGMDAQARLALQQGLSASDQQNKANQSAVMQGMARRGLQNSGDQMAAQLGAASQSANSSRDAALSASAEARNRALAALQGSAQVGGQMRGQDIGIESANQAAENARNAFNAKMISATDQFNSQGQLENDLAKLKRQQIINAAKTRLADRVQARGEQTAGDYSSMGRALSGKMNIAANGSEEYGG